MRRASVSNQRCTASELPLVDMLSRPSSRRQRRSMSQKV